MTTCELFAHVFAVSIYLLCIVVTYIHTSFVHSHDTYVLIGTHPVVLGIPTLKVCLTRGTIFRNNGFFIRPIDFLRDEVKKPFHDHRNLHHQHGPAWRLRPQAPAGYWTRRFMVSCFLGDVQVIQDWTAEGLLELVRFALAEIESSYLRRQYCPYAHSYVCSEDVSVPLPSAQEAVEILQAGVTPSNGHLFDNEMTLERVIYLKKIENKTRQWLALDPKERRDRLTILHPRNVQSLGGRATELPESIKNCIITQLMPGWGVTAEDWLGWVN